jgi:hypothetical protein
MLLNDIYYEAGEIARNASAKPSWAKPYGHATQRQSRGPRAVVGHALMSLGRVIAAEPKTAAPARVRIDR